jgi:hypothetical protein
MFRKALVGLFACSFFLSAQTTTTLYGTVTDKSGAIVPGAQVVATNIGTNQSRTAQTSQEDDGDGLGGGAHLELDVEAQFLVDLEFEIRVAVGGESAGRGVQGVAAGVEVGGGEIARAVADTAMGLVGFEVGYLNGDGGTTAPEGSVTRPTTLADGVWAARGSREPRTSGNRERIGDYL